LNAEAEGLARLKKYIVEKSKEMKTACNLAEACGSRKVVLPLMSMNMNLMMVVVVVTSRLNLNIFKVI
jgi:hypothetical protein